jgi:hypothetical protein
LRCGLIHIALTQTAQYSASARNGNGVAISDYEELTIGAGNAGFSRGGFG